jgi:hypothetical protein
MKDGHKRTRDESDEPVMEATNSGNGFPHNRKVSLSPVTMMENSHDNDVSYARNTAAQGAFNTTIFETANDFEMNHYDDGNHEHTAVDYSSNVGPSEFEIEREKIRNNRKSVYLEIARKLEESLNQIKATTKTLLSAVDEYTKEIESIETDYASCRDSQRSESCRLEDVEPDVSILVNTFLRFAQSTEELS